MDLDKKKEKEKQNIFHPSYLFNNHAVAVQKYEDIRASHYLPENIIAVAFHRRFYNKKHGLFSKQ
jgi:hypothetical protein